LNSAYPGGVEFLKAHGTGNDFVLLPDPEGSLRLSDSQVAAICDRRRGLGGDGVLRVVPVALAGEDLTDTEDAHWFMDYRNADGSRAEMCGNGARVFARYLVDQGLHEPGAMRFATRGGVRGATVPAAGDVEVDMGPATGSQGVDITVGVLGKPRRAHEVHIPNPHAVVFVDDVRQAGPLLQAPDVAPESVFPKGVNVEFVSVEGLDHIRMRVFERGVGETLSCGTGACAAAWSYVRNRRPGGAVNQVRVDVPGGSLVVTFAADGRVLLRGPVTYVARGELEESFLVGAVGAAT